jgi:hypothetical protein
MAQGKREALMKKPIFRRGSCVKNIEIVICISVITGLIISACESVKLRREPNGVKLSEKVITYPNPPGILASNHYQVKILDSQSQAFSSFVYQVKNPEPSTKNGSGISSELDTSWTSFS